jgi:hypothetical protein
MSPALACHRAPAAGDHRGATRAGGAAPAYACKIKQQRSGTGRGPSRAGRGGSAARAAGRAGAHVGPRPGRGRPRGSRPRRPAAPRGPGAAVAACMAAWGCGRDMRPGGGAGGAAPAGGISGFGCRAAAAQQRRGAAAGRGAARPPARPPARGPMAPPARCDVHYRVQRPFRDRLLRAPQSARPSRPQPIADPASPGTMASANVVKKIACIGAGYVGG